MIVRAPVLLSATEVAARLGISRPTVYRMVRERELPAVRLRDRDGSTVRVDADALERWIDAHTTGGAA